MRFSIGCWASLQGFARCALSQAAWSASLARYACKPPLRFTSRLIVEGERPSSFAMLRKDRAQAIPLEISSRSESVSTNLARWRGGGRMPPVGDSWANIEDEGRSNALPMALSDSPRCQRVHISVFSTLSPDSFYLLHPCSRVPPYNLFVFGIPFSTLHLFVIKIKCCIDQLKPPLKAFGHV